MNAHAIPSIMLVEDDLRLSELVSRYLENNGFRLTTLARGDRVAVVLPDVVIPAVAMTLLVIRWSPQTKIASWCSRQRRVCD